MNSDSSTTHTFHVTGTHCSACKHLIESILAEDENVAKVDVVLNKEIVAITTHAHVLSGELAVRLTPLLSTHGYVLHADKPAGDSAKHEWLYAVPFTLLAVLSFILLERAGLTSLIGTSEASLTTALLVGLVASVSTCLAVVGGLVLSVSATYAHEGKGWRPQALFHAGRLLGFFLLGGLLGVLGEAVQIGFYGTMMLGVVASIVMLLLGIHLLDITKKVRIFTLPKSISHTLADAAHRAGMFAPILLGAVTFFLPCGFTQSMQIVALSSGSFTTASLTMTAFALGTFPVLALLSFGSLDLAKSRFRGIFFKSAGLLVILFALWNLQNALAVFGIIRPLVTF